MPNVQITSNAITGDATAQTVAVKDHTRRYLALYSQTGNCVISVGDGVHATNAITLAQGNMFELAVNSISKVEYSGAGTVLVTLTDLSARVVLTSDGYVLTSDGEPLAYAKANYRLAPPVFS